MKFTRTDAPGGTTLRIEGSLDALSTPELRDTVDALVREKARLVTLDLSAMRLIDSSGVGVIVALYKRLRAEGGDLKVTGLRDQPLAIFKLLKLDRVFGV